MTEQAIENSGISSFAVSFPVNLGISVNLSMNFILLLTQELILSLFFYLVFIKLEHCS